MIKQQAMDKRIARLKNNNIMNLCDMHMEQNTKNMFQYAMIKTNSTVISSILNGNELDPENFILSIRESALKLIDEYKSAIEDIEDIIYSAEIIKENLKISE